MSDTRQYTLYMHKKSNTEQSVVVIFDDKTPVHDSMERNYFQKKKLTKTQLAGRLYFRELVQENNKHQFKYFIFNLISSSQKIPQDEKVETALKERYNISSFDEIKSINADVTSALYQSYEEAVLYTKSCNSLTHPVGTEITAAMEQKSKSTALSSKNKLLLNSCMKAYIHTTNQDRYFILINRDGYRFDNVAHTFKQKLGKDIPLDIKYCVKKIKIKNKDQYKYKYLIIKLNGEQIANIIEEHVNVKLNRLPNIELKYLNEIDHNLIPANTSPAQPSTAIFSLASEHSFFSPKSPTPETQPDLKMPQNNQPDDNTEDKTSEASEAFFNNVFDSACDPSHRDPQNQEPLNLNFTP